MDIAKTVRLFILMAAGCAAGAGEMRIGWASTSITPNGTVAIEGGWGTKLSTSVGDPLTATALALEGDDGRGGTDQAILVSCDLVAIRDGMTEALREQVRNRLPGFDTRKLTVSATHTHQAPAISPGLYILPEGRNVIRPEEYRRFLNGRLADIVERAWRDRRPGGVSWGLGQAVVAQNRRVVYREATRAASSFSPGKAVMYGQTGLPEFSGLEGFEDHAVQMLYFFSPEKKLTGIAIHVPCPAQASGGSALTADYWHDVRAGLRERFAQDLFVLPLIGASGDQSPRMMVRRAAEERMWRLRGLSYRQEIARRIAASVQDVFEVVRADLRFDAPVVHHVEDLELPARPVTAKDAEEARESNAGLMKLPPAERQNRIVRNNAVLARYENRVRTCRMELHVIRLGDIAIATNPFELFTDYGIQVQARSRAVQTFVVQLTNGSAFYLPTERALQNGGYSTEARVNLAGPEGARVLVDRTVEVINSLYPAGDSGR